MFATFKFYFSIFTEDLIDNEDCKPNGSKCDLVQIFQIFSDSLTNPSTSSISLPTSNYNDQTISGHNSLPMKKDDDENISFLFSSNNRPNLNQTGSSSIYRYGTCNIIFNEQL